MFKKMCILSSALILGACVSGGNYPAAQTNAASGMDNAALVGQVINALATPQQPQNAYIAPNANNGNMLGGVIGALAAPQQAPAQHYGQPYAQPNTLGSVLGAMGGQGNVNALIQGVMVNQCRSYINNQPMWQTARMALGNQAQHWEGQICQCATQEAMNTMTAEQLAQLGMSAVGGQAAMTQATAGLLSQTAMNCTQRIARQNGWWL